VEADRYTAVESRDGNVYCGNCQDFIYDPIMEIRRLQKGGLIHILELGYMANMLIQAKSENSKTLPPPTTSS